MLRAPVEILPTPSCVTSQVSLFTCNVIKNDHVLELKPPHEMRKPKLLEG